MSHFFDPDGEPMSVHAWAAAYANWRSRVVCDSGPGDVRVVTVWHGLPPLCLEGPPLIFGSLVSGGVLDGVERQYATRQQAIAGHYQLLHETQLLQEAL
jgi:hypothetical protein